MTVAQLFHDDNECPFFFLLIFQDDLVQRGFNALLPYLEKGGSFPRLTGDDISLEFS